MDLPALEVCGEASNGQEAVEKVLSLKPDLVLMDLSMPVMNGFSAMTKIREIAPDVKIIVLSVDGDMALATGADAPMPRALSRLDASA